MFKGQTAGISHHAQSLYSNAVKLINWQTWIVTISDVLLNDENKINILKLICAPESHQLS